MASKYRTVAERSRSVFCLPEPADTKAVFRGAAEELLRALERLKGRVRFVQVGANDGQRGDLLNPFVKSGRWQGVLVEPVPAAMARLQAEYSGIDGLAFAQLAIWPDDSPPPFWEVEGADVLSSFSRETIRLHAGKYDDLEAMTKPLEVEVMRLDELCAAHGIEPDVIAIDAEGMDDVVLSSFDLDRHRVPVVLFEHVALSEAASSALKHRLEALGYILIHDRHDCLCIQAPPLDRGLTESCRGRVLAARAETLSR
jgi:FkbM family methyltransferase